MTFPLPDIQTFNTSLFEQLSYIPGNDPENRPSNPFQEVPQSFKDLFLTLHCLYPDELLPALDLLDRKLVTKFTISPGAGEEGNNPPEAENSIRSQDEKFKRKNIVYYVRSSQPIRASRYAAAGGSNHEVRLKAWNCSCPAFTFSALRNLKGGRGTTGMQSGDLQSSESEGHLGWRFGNLLLSTEAAPLCKHLLACLLLEKCPLLSGFVEEKLVSKDEAAGWAAGWGD